MHFLVVRDIWCPVRFRGQLCREEGKCELQSDQPSRVTTRGGYAKTLQISVTCTSTDLRPQLLFSDAHGIV